MATDNTIKETFIADTQGFSQPVSQMARQAEAAGAVIGQLKAAIGAIGGVVKSVIGHAIDIGSVVAEIGSKAEQAQIQVAGFMTGLGMSKDIESGMKDASRVMDKIIHDSAALPGEAEDYIEVFKMGLPYVSRALKGNVGDFVSFSNKISAVGITFGIGASQIGRDLQRMLAPGAGLARQATRTFQNLLPFMKQVEGHANLTAQSFNEMTEQQRAELLVKTLEKLQPMLDQASNSWESQVGALQSNTRLVGRYASSPLFEQMKASLRDINALLFDSEGNLTKIASIAVEVGKIFSTHIAEVLKTIGNWVENAVDGFTRWLAVLSKTTGFRGLEGALGSVMEMQEQSPLKLGLTGLARGSLGGAIATVAGIGIGKFLQNTDAVGKSLEGLSSTIQSVLSTIDPVWNLLQKLGDAFGVFLSTVMPPLFEAGAAVVAGLSQMYNAVVEIISVIADSLAPYLSDFGTIVADMLQAVGELASAAFPVLIDGVRTFFSFVSTVAIPVLGFLIDVFKGLIQIVTLFMKTLAWLLKQIPGAPKFEIPKTVGEAGRFEAFNKLLAGLFEKKPLVVDVESLPRATAPDIRPGEPYMDFRGSKFDITQKFAEGFDPDRIAIAFADDLARVAEMRLQSGFEPIMGIR